MSNKHKLEFTDDEFETLHIVVNDGIKKLDAMPHVDLMEASRKQWLKIFKDLKEKLWAESPPKGLQLDGFQLGHVAVRAQSGQRRKKAS